MGAAFTRVTVRRRDQLDRLCARWRAAFDTAERALESVNAVLSDDTLHRRALHLRDERSSAALILESLARDRHLAGWSADLHSSPHVRR